MSAVEQQRAAAIEAYRRRAAEAGLAPLWDFFEDWFGREPRVEAVAHLWRYDAVRTLLLEAGPLIGAAAAERRVLALENPGLVGARLATDALYAGLQLVVPGETAPPHRHTPAALRFILEGRGAYTEIAGKRVPMAPGDLITTPSWSWHEHGNETSEPAIWLDVLDVALLRFLGAQFSEPHPARSSPAGRAAAPDKAATTTARRRFHYPFAESLERLADVRRRHAADACHGFRIEYLDRESGGPALATLSTFLQCVPAGFRTAPYRNTASAVYSVVEGSGRAAVGSHRDQRELVYGPRDTFVVPSWQPLTIEADVETILFSASDRAAQQSLGVWREEPSDGPHRDLE